MYGSRAYRHWPGNPQITTRVNEEIFQAVNTEARRRGVPRAIVAREIFLEWAQNGLKVLSQPAPSAALVAPVLPATAPGREATGRSEPASVLQAVDGTREAAKGTGREFKD